MSRGNNFENKNKTKKKKKISIQFEGQGPTFKFIFSIQYRFYLANIQGFKGQKFRNRNKVKILNQ